MAPIYYYTTVTMTKPWLTRNYLGLGGRDFFNWTIDWEAKKGRTRSITKIWMHVLV